MTKLPALDDLISLQSKRALITGAAAGIGKAIARRLGEAGAALDLIDLDAKKLHQTATELRQAGYSVSEHILDLAKRDAIEQFWNALNLVPDILINNAGIYPTQHFSQLTAETYDRVMDINLHAVTFMCQNFIRRRIKQGGVIVNISSIEAILPFKEDLATYSVSKAGVIALTRALAHEYAQHGFRINAIVPGGILTEGTKAVAAQVLHLKFGLIKTGYDFQQRLPAGRMGQPDDVARMVLVLTCDLASYVHGVLIPVDGGFLSS